MYDPFLFESTIYSPGDYEGRPGDLYIRGKSYIIYERSFLKKISLAGIWKHKNFFDQLLFIQHFICGQYTEYIAGSSGHNIFCLMCKKWIRFFKFRKIGSDKSCP